MIDHVRCSRCGKRVSNDVEAPAIGLIVRAWVECPECIEAPDKVVAEAEAAARAELVRRQGEVHEFVHEPEHEFCGWCQAAEDVPCHDVEAASDEAGICRSCGDTLAPDLLAADIDHCPTCAGVPDREEIVERARVEIAEAARFGHTRHWIKARAVMALVGCPRCGRRAGEKCARLNNRGAHPASRRNGVDPDITDLHPERYRQPEAVEMVEQLNAIYAEARRALGK